MFFRILLLDLKCGLWSQWKKYMLSILFFVICSGILFLQWRNQQYTLPEEAHTVPTLGDCLLFFFGGCDLYLFDRTRPFIFPAQWMVLLLLVLYLNLYYTNDSLHGIGVQFMTRLKSRSAWWISKSICVTAGVLLYYLLGILTTIVTCLLLGGNLSLQVSPLLPDVMEIYALHTRQPALNLLPAYMLSVCTVLFLCQLQLVLTVVMRPILSFLILAAYLLLSSYFMSPFLPANYAMPVRSELYVEGGLAVSTGFLTIGILLVLTLLIGWLYFKRTDILNREE